MNDFARAALLRRCCRLLSSSRYTTTTTTPAHRPFSATPPLLSLPLPARRAAVLLPSERAVAAVRPWWKKSAPVQSPLGHRSAAAAAFRRPASPSSGVSSERTAVLYPLPRTVFAARQYPCTQPPSQPASQPAKGGQTLRREMLPTAMLLHVALATCLASVTLAAESGPLPPPLPPVRRPSPYSAFRSIRPPAWFRVEPAPSRRAESFVEVPNLESPGGDFVGHPLDYGSSLNFGGPLATTVGKVKVLDYASRLNAEGGSSSRYGKPLIKPYESIYESKSQGAQKYASAAKKQKPPRPTSRSQQGESSENEIEGSSVGGGVKDEALPPMQPSSLEDDQLPPFDFATSRSGEESRESPFPEAGEMAGFFF